MRKLDITPARRQLHRLVRPSRRNNNLRLVNGILNNDPTAFVSPDFESSNRVSGVLGASTVDICLVRTRCISSIDWLSDVFASVRKFDNLPNVSLAEGRCIRPVYLRLKGHRCKVWRRACTKQ